MKDYEKAIEEAAIKQRTVMNGSLEYAFVSGAKSPEAKELHQYGMYSEEEVDELLVQYMLHCDECKINDSFPDNASEWFRQNKKK